MHAAFKGHVATVALLLDRGADINHKDKVSYCDVCIKASYTMILSVNVIYDSLCPDTFSLFHVMS